MTTETPALDERIQRMRKLRGKASRLKLDLHDLAEDLPTDWEKIPELAEQTHAVHAELAALEAELKVEGLL
jgi:hypothetical protein